MRGGDVKIIGMSVAGAQADAFYREVLAGEHVYGVRDNGGFPAPMTSTGVRAMPFWSKRSRAQRIVENVEAYAGMDVVELTVAEWLEKWVPGLERDGLMIGLNWSGQGAVGYDITPSDLLRNLEARRGLGESRDEA